MGNKEGGETEKQNIGFERAFEKEKEKKKKNTQTKNREEKKKKTRAREN